MVDTRHSHARCWRGAGGGGAVLGITRQLLLIAVRQIRHIQPAIANAIADTFVDAVTPSMAILPKEVKHAHQ